MDKRVIVLILYVCLGALMSGCIRSEMEKPTVHVINMSAKTISEIRYASCNDRGAVRKAYGRLGYSEKVTITFQSTCVDIMVFDEGGQEWARQQNVAIPPSFTWTIK